MKNRKLIYIRMVITTVIGLILLISGISKIFEFTDFVNTISSIITDSFFSIIIGFIVIAIEIILGALLLFRIYIEKTLLLTALLMITFIAVLYYKELFGITVNCNCFGFLNLNFSYQTQIWIDFIILYFTLFLTTILKWDELKLKLLNNKSQFITMGLIGFFIQYTVLSASPKIVDTQFFDLSPLKEVVHHNNLDSYWNSEKEKVIFLMSFKDFSCPLCYDDFLSFSEKISEKKTNDLSLLYLFEENNDSGILLTDKRLKLWAKSKNINSKILLMNKMLLAFNIHKSSVVVLNSDNKVKYFSQFPINRDKKEEIINYLVE